MDKPFYYEGNYVRGLGSDILYAIITIAEGDFSIDGYEEEYGQQDIDFSLDYLGKEKGKFKVEYGSNWDGTEAVSFVDTLEDAKSEYERMEDSYCDGMSKQAKPLEELIINHEPIIMPQTPACKMVQGAVKRGDIVNIKIPPAS
jgi:hypothetical protein